MTKLSEEDKQTLMEGLVSPDITDELLAAAFNSCEGEACRHIVRLQGSRLPQDDLDRALLEHIIKESPLVYDLLQYSRANPHRYGAGYLENLSKDYERKLLPFVINSVSFYPTADDNAWLNYIIKTAKITDNLGIHLLLNDPRHTAKLNLTEFLNRSLEERNGEAALIIASHPECDMDKADTRFQKVLYFSTLKNYLKMAKDHNGCLTSEDMKTLKLYSDTGILFFMLYAASCSGNLEMLRQIQKLIRQDPNRKHYMMMSELDLASVAISHGNHELAKYFMKGNCIGMEDYNQMLNAAQRAGRPDLADWIMDHILQGVCPMILEDICLYLDEFIGTARYPTNNDLYEISKMLTKFIDKNPNYSAVTRQIVRTLQHKLTILELQNKSLPKDIVDLIANMILNQPFFI